MRSLRLAFLACAALCAAHAAAAADLTPMDCAVAYGAAARERLRSRGPEYRGLIAQIPNAEAVNFDERAGAMSNRFGVNPMDAGSKAVALAETMKMQAHVAEGDSVLQPERVYEAERGAYALIRQCDAAYGFTPVLAEPPSAEAVLAQFADRRKREAEQKAASDAALDDAQCAVRFWLVGMASQGNTQVQQVMSQKIEVAAGKAMTAQPGMTQERLTEFIKREGTARAEKINAGSWSLDHLLKDTNTCETRYGMPLTTRGAPAP